MTLQHLHDAITLTRTFNTNNNRNSKNSRNRAAFLVNWNTSKLVFTWQNAINWALQHCI